MREVDHDPRVVGIVLDHQQERLTGRQVLPVIRDLLALGWSLQPSDR